MPESTLATELKLAIDKIDARLFDLHSLPQTASPRQADFVNALAKTLYYENRTLTIRAAMSLLGQRSPAPVQSLIEYCVDKQLVFKMGRKGVFLCTGPYELWALRINLVHSLGLLEQGVLTMPNPNWRKYDDVKLLLPSHGPA